MAMPHTLIFTAKAPPSSAASALVLERLTFGTEEYFGYIHQMDDLPRQAMKSAHVPVKNSFGVLSQRPLLWRFEQFGWYRLAVREGLKQADNSKWDVILACHPSMAFSLAAAKVARSRGIPLVLYLMDLFAESRVNPIEKIWAGFTEKKLMEQASAVICLTEGIQKYYADKYHVNSVLIPHCVTEVEIAEALANKPDLTVGSPVVIAYAGGVYQARLDSLMVVKQAIDELNAQGFPSKLLILGKNDPAQLTDWGIGGPNVSVRFIKDRSEFMGQLRRSDILLSTIAFKSAYPLQDQTCFPTKTFDYFLAGKPVLAVAPNHTAYGGYMKEHQSAIVVGSLNAEVIAEHIHQLATDMDQRRQLVDAGFAQLDTHHQRNVQPILQNVLRQDFKGIVA